MPVIDIFTLPWFIGEIRGYSKLYDYPSEIKGGWWYMAISAIGYLTFCDVLIYWIHRLEHHPRIYKYVHKVSFHQ